MIDIIYIKISLIKNIVFILYKLYFSQMISIIIAVNYHFYIKINFI